jgi:hypothetical protein
VAQANEFELITKRIKEQGMGEQFATLLGTVSASEIFTHLIGIKTYKL